VNLANLSSTFTSGTVPNDDKLKETLEFQGFAPKHVRTMKQMAISYLLAPSLDTLLGFTAGIPARALHLHTYDQWAKSVNCPSLSIAIEHQLHGVHGVIRIGHRCAFQTFFVQGRGYLCASLSSKTSHSTTFHCGFELQWQSSTLPHLAADHFMHERTFR
jgi:hypothetical protein